MCIRDSLPTVARVYDENTCWLRTSRDRLRLAILIKRREREAEYDKYERHKQRQQVS